MSRRRRNRTSAPVAGAASRAPGTNGPQIQAFNLSGYEAANPSHRRAFVPRTTLDSAKMLTGYDRTILLNLSNWAYINIGLARRIVNGLAYLVGYLTPQASTRDKAWNSAIENQFRLFAGSAGVFDRAGKLNFHAWQIANTRGRFRHGDIASVLSETDSGIARVIVYEAPQIGDGDQYTGKPDNLRDGVYVDKFGRHTAYRIIDRNDPKKWTVVPANDTIFHADFENLGSSRGIPILAHALINLQDRAEVQGAIKHIIKIGAQVGMYKKRDYGPVHTGEGFGPRVTEDTGLTDSNGNAIRQNIEKQTGGGFVDDTLGRGESWELLHDDRPHPNQREFLEDLVRDIAWGVGVAPEILWQIASQTGPSTRYLMSELKRWITNQHNILRPICQRFWVYFVAKEIKSGRMPFPEGDDAWWKCEWVPQEDLTIDKGREGNLQLEQLRNGATNFSEVWKQSGGDFESGIARQIDCLKYAKELAAENGFTLEQVLPGFINKPAPAPNQQQQSSDPAQQAA